MRTQNLKIKKNRTLQGRLATSSGNSRMKMDNPQETKNNYKLFKGSSETTRYTPLSIMLNKTYVE